MTTKTSLTIASIAIQRCLLLQCSTLLHTGVKITIVQVDSTLWALDRVNAVAGSCHSQSIPTVEQMADNWEHCIVGFYIDMTLVHISASHSEQVTISAGSKLIVRLF